MQKTLLTLFFVIITITFFGQTEQTFTPIQLRNDVDSMVAYLEQIHPNPYYRFSKVSFYKDVQAIKKSFNKDLNEVEFYLKIVPLLGKLDDGHTDLHIMSKYNEENPIVIPYNFDLSPTKPYIICRQSYPFISAQIPDNVEVISINNIPAQKIVNDIIELNTGENRLFRAQFGATRFYFYLEALYKLKGIYKVKYKANEKIIIAVVKGIKQTEFEATKSKNDSAANSLASSNFSLQLIDSNSTAIIEFKSFDWDGFIILIDSAFTVIKEKNIQNLIINLMDDGGGDSDVGDEFFQYILNQPFRQYDKILEKNSEPLKERLRQHLAEKKKQADSADQVLLSRINGSYDTAYYDNIQIRENPLRFTGKFFLLINLQTYSSAADFAQCFKYQKRGMLIGKETGGLVESYGDIVSAILPNTKLEMTVSSKLYYDAGIKDNEWHGVIPDVSVSDDEALKKALEIIHENKSGK